MEEQKEQEKPLISVIIPTFNRKDLVVESINSVLQQEPKNYEVIVVDDGSTDGTAPYLGSLYLSIKVIRKIQGGVSSARNFGIQNAKGDYIAFLDSDDLWLPGILKEQLNYLENNPNIPLVYTDEYIEVNGKKQEKTRFQSVKVTEKQKRKFLLPGFVEYTPIHISSVMARRSVFDDTGYFNEDLKIHEDTEFWNRISENYELGFIDKPLAIFRWEKDPEHILKADYRIVFVREGRKYMKIYEERRRKKGLTREEKKAIEESNRRLSQLEKLILLRDSNQISDQEFNKRKTQIFG